MTKVKRYRTEFNILGQRRHEYFLISINIYTLHYWAGVAAASLFYHDQNYGSTMMSGGLSIWAASS